LAVHAFQDYYPDHLSHCYGCGRLNEHGLQIKSYWNGEETFCHFYPKPYHSGGFPGYMYGGLIASLIDCHSAATAAASVYRAEGRAMDSLPAVRFVTASLKVDYLRPTPLGGDPLELRSSPAVLKGRKAVVMTTLLVRGVICARGQVIAVRLPGAQAAKPSPAGL
jgi:acyl-coenzyme A thioesterase PaaI-like protein